MVHFDFLLCFCLLNKKTWIYIMFQHLPHAIDARTDVHKEPHTVGRINLFVGCVIFFVGGWDLRAVLVKKYHHTGCAHSSRLCNIGLVRWRMWRHRYNELYDHSQLCATTEDVYCNLGSLGSGRSSLDCGGARGTVISEPKKLVSQIRTLLFWVIIIIILLIITIWLLL